MSSSNTTVLFWVKALKYFVGKHPAPTISPRVPPIFLFSSFDVQPKVDDFGKSQRHSDYTLVAKLEEISTNLGNLSLSRTSM